MLLLVFTCLLALAACGNDSDGNAFQGSEYEFVLKDMSGNPVELFHEEHKTVVLYFTGID